MRLIKRYQGGGWAGVANAAVTGVSNVIQGIFDKKKAEEQKKAAILNNQTALSIEKTALLKTQLAQAMAAYDRQGSTTADVLRGGIGVTTPITYDNGSVTPEYSPVSSFSSSAAAGMGGVAGSLVGSLFTKKGDDDDVYSGVPLDQQSPEERRRNNQRYREKLALKGKLGGEQPPTEPVTPTSDLPEAVTGDLGAALPEAGTKGVPTGAPNELKDMKVAKEKVTAAKIKSDKTAAAKDGCKLKKRFNPRLFKKQK